MAAPDHVKRGKMHLLLTLCIVGAGMLAGPYLLASTQLIPELHAKAWVVLAVAFGGILIKSGVSYLTTRDFRYDKTAYDLCILVFGGALACMAVQILSNDDLFPGLRKISFLSIISSTGLAVNMQNVAILSGLLAASLIGTIFAAIGVADTEAGKPNWLWTLACSFVAYAFVGAYALTLISKG